MQTRTLFITGATGGLGEAVVRRLAREYRCAVLYRSRDRFDRLAASIDSASLSGIRGDLGDSDSLERAADEASEGGRLWGLVHLAGGFEAGLVAETSVETWDRLIALNLRGAFLAFRAVLPRLRKAGGGRIVAVGSLAGIELPTGVGAYAVSKAALGALVSVTAKEVSGIGITVNAVMPDSLDTDAMRAADLGIPLVSVARVADTIAWLLSDDAANTTGAALPMRAGGG